MLLQQLKKVNADHFVDAKYNNIGVAGAAVCYLIALNFV